MADNDLIEQSVLSLIAFGMALPATISPTDIRKVYGFALAGIAQGAVRAATEKLMRGAYGPEYTDFIPTPPRFSSFAQLEQAHIVADLAREKAKANPQVDERTTPEPTEEEKARVRAKLGAFRLQSAEFRRGPEKPTSEALTEDKRAYYASIMELPDRASITAEERQERNRIIAKMEMAQ